jgi:hypothetical protein
MVCLCSIPEVLFKISDRIKDAVFEVVSETKVP